eukprot:GFYU01020678.1.p1 GENE.GFYU01020678.1~~GFYU01020678.1.p1  ORF type:complete len:254 (+),score=54.40 GFYU01020678.1:72-833(+)
MSKADKGEDELQLTILGQVVHVVTNNMTLADCKEVLRWHCFKDWVRNIETTQWSVTKITFESVTKSEDNKLLFVKFDATIYADEGGQRTKLPGTVYLRQQALAILIVITCEDEEYTILTKRPRVPVGKDGFPEIPAGMIDKNGDVGPPANLKEKCDIQIEPKNMVDLTYLAYGDKWPGMYPSAGGCNEFVRLFLYRDSWDRQNLDALEQRLFHDNSFNIVPLADVWRETPDGKTFSAWALYTAMRDAGILPEM